MPFSNEDEAFMRVALEQVRFLQCSMTCIIACFICVGNIDCRPKKRLTVARFLLGTFLSTAVGTRKGNRMQQGNAL